MKKALFYGLTTLVVGYLIALYIFDPKEYSLFPRCVFYSLTGLKCAGCGGQRALHSLLRGEFLQALKYNCFLTVFLPVFAVGWYKGPFANKRWYPFFGLAVMILFIIVRNLPGATL